MSEWGVADLQAAVEKIASEDDGALAEAFKKHFGVWARRFEPYQWWDEADFLSGSGQRLALGQLDAGADGSAGAKPELLRLRLKPGLFLPGQMLYRLENVRFHYEGGLFGSDGPSIAGQPDARFPSRAAGDIVLTGEAGGDGTRGEAAPEPVEVCPELAASKDAGSEGVSSVPVVEAIERHWSLDEQTASGGPEWQGRALTRYEVEAEVKVVFLDELGRPREVGLAGTVGGRIGIRWLEKTYQGKGLPMADKECRTAACSRGKSATTKRPRRKSFGETKSEKSALQFDLQLLTEVREAKSMSVVTSNTEKVEYHLTDEEARYIQRHFDIEKRLCIAVILFLFAIGVGFGILSWVSPDKGMYFYGFVSLLSTFSALASSALLIPRFARLEVDDTQEVKKRQVEIFPLPLVWFQPTKGCKIISERAFVPSHWSSYFNYLRPIGGDGSISLEARVYEATNTNYVLSLSNGLSVEKEMTLKVFNTLTVNIVRGLTWSLFVFVSVVFVGFLLNELLRIFPVASSLTEFFEELLLPLLVALAFLIVLGIPALYFWHQHKRALARIEAMYADQGLPERGHERNVGSAIGDASPLPSSTSGHDESGGDARVNERTS